MNDDLRAARLVNRLVEDALDEPLERLTLAAPVDEHHAVLHQSGVLEGLRHRFADVLQLCTPQCGTHFGCRDFKAMEFNRKQHSCGPYAKHELPSNIHRGGN